MMPEEIYTLFAKVLKLFEPVLSQPKDADLQRICEAIVTILLSIPYNENGGKDNLVILIISDAKYTDL